MMATIFDALQTIAQGFTWLAAMIGWWIIGAGIAHARNLKDVHLWIYGIISLVVGVVMTGVSFW